VNEPVALVLLLASAGAGLHLTYGNEAADRAALDLMHRTARTFLLALVASLLIFGITMLYSTSYAAFAERMLARQLTWVAAGSLGAVLLWRTDYRWLGRRSWILLILVSVALAYLALAFVLYKLPFIPNTFAGSLPFIGGPTKGSFRWLRLGPFSLQPSEFAKLILILFLADYFGRRARHIMEFRRGFLHPMLVAGAVLALIFLGKDFSTTVIGGAVVMNLAFIAGVRLRYLTIVGIVGILFAVAALWSSPERMRRLTVFRNPERHQYTDGYQLWCSQLALGSGGVRGLGFTSSRMKQFYLPEAHTDFIAAIVGEELGFVAVGALILAYCLLVGAAFWLAALAPDRQGALLCMGIGLSIGLHAFVNVSVVSGFCPTTGVTAPFLSYGGSSMLASLLGVGLLLSVSRVSEAESLAHAERGRALTEFAPGTED